MRKSTLFISAVLTTFMLAILVGAVSAYQGTISSAGAVVAQPTQTEAAVADTAEPTDSAVLTPEQAAALAAKVLGKTDLFSVETSTFENADAYLVTFSSGDLVYVSPVGEILSIGKVATVASTYYAPPAPTKKAKSKPSSTSTGGGSGDDGGGDDD